MGNQIWRYSHLALAIVVTLPLLLACLTGIILAFEPIQKSWQPLAVSGADRLTVGALLSNLKDNYQGILDVEQLDKNVFKLSTMDGDFIIDPFTGDQLGEIPQPSPFFQWVTNLHRSLFLKSTGRLIIGLTSLLFLLSIITGLMLLRKREGGFRAIYKKTIKTRLDQYAHVVISKWTWLPLLIIAFSGVWLSLLRFGIIPEPEMMDISPFTKEVAQSRTQPSNFLVFQSVSIDQLEKLEFPFSEDSMDPFTLLTRHRKYVVHQYDGTVLEQYQNSTINKFSELNFQLHTGRDSAWWSLMLGGSTAGVLFLIYSGFSIAFQRSKGRFPQMYTPQEAETIILFGSENGSTKNHAIALHKALLDVSHKSYLTDLNAFTDFPSARRLFILTSTYGDGVAPVNANRFLSLLAQKNGKSPIDFAVLGFGSKAYPKFGQFAKDVDQDLGNLKFAHRILPLKVIHNQARHDFNEWVRQLAVHLALPLAPGKYLNTRVPRLDPFRIVQKEIVDVDGQQTFLLTLELTRKRACRSGDLLDFYPESDPVKRSYSIAKNENGQILLAIKRHTHGVVSNDLFQRSIGEVVYATVKSNAHFHFPEQASTVTMIGNGTGMGPFLGMVPAHSSKSIHLYWGGRNSLAFSLYKPHLDKAAQVNTTFKYQVAFSREGKRLYVQHLIEQDQEQIVDRLEKGGAILICGSVAMQEDVLKVLAKATEQYGTQPLHNWVQEGRIQMDCY